MIKRLVNPLLNNRGCFGGSPNVIPTPTPAPQQAQGNVRLAEDETRRRRRAAASNTILTSPMGAQAPTMQPKSLLGS